MLICGCLSSACPSSRLAISSGANRRTYTHIINKLVKPLFLLFSRTFRKLSAHSNQNVGAKISHLLSYTFGEHYCQCFSLKFRKISPQVDRNRAAIREEKTHCVTILWYVKIAFQCCTLNKLNRTNELANSRDGTSKQTHTHVRIPNENEMCAHNTNAVNQFTAVKLHLFFLSDSD